MLRIWLGAIKARTFQVKAETTSLTLSHPIVPGYCSCWKGKIRAVTVWRVNESWGTLKSRIIWLPHTMHCSHVLAILMQSSLGEGENEISLRLRVHTEGTSGESRKSTFLIKARDGTGFVEAVRSSKDLNHQNDRITPAPSDSGEAAGESLTIQELFRRGSFWQKKKKFHFSDFFFSNNFLENNFFFLMFQHTNVKFPENQNCFLFPKGTHWDIGHTEE